MNGAAASLNRQPPPSRHAGEDLGLPVRRAYDAAAATYDQQVAASAWVRERLWLRLDQLLTRGARVLDATAGTGNDAVHLAARGAAVTACDLSPAMLDRLAAKDGTIRIRVVDCGRLAAAFPGERFDAVLSTFAGLNTAADLDAFARGAAALLAPGGLLFVHLLNRWPVADLVRRFRRGQLAAGCAAVAASWRGERRVRIGGVWIEHRLHAPRGLYRRVFSRDFALRRIAAQGVLRPVDDPRPRRREERPGYREERPGRRQERLGRWEERLGRWPGSRGLGTFFTLEMRRRATRAWQQDDDPRDDRRGTRR